MVRIEGAASAARRRSVGRNVALVAALALGFAAARVMALEPPGRSPGEYVVSQGLADPPGSDLVWRTAVVPVGTDGSADVNNGEPGFILARGTAVLVSDGATGQTTLLNGEEATFVAAGHAATVQAWRDDGEVTTITLATAGTPAAGDPLYVSPAFAGLGGPHDLDLIAGHLEAGESTSVNPVGDSFDPVLVFVQRGSVVISEDGGHLATIAAGEAAAIPLGDLIDPDAVGDSPRLEVTAGDEGAAFVAALVGWGVDVF